MDRIARIIELEKASIRRDTTSSTEKWEAAHLIWLELNQDNPPSKAALGEKIGRTPQHVLYMSRCWDNFVAKPGIEWLGEPDYASLGSFYEVYNSDDVRGKGTNSRKARPEPRETTGKADHSQDFSGHTLVTDAHTALSILSNNPGYWAALSSEDWDMIQAIPDMISRITGDDG